MHHCPPMLARWQADLDATAGFCETPAANFGQGANCECLTCRRARAVGRWGGIAVTRKLLYLATLALPVFVLASAEAQAQTSKASPSVWNRAVEATAGLFRRPDRRAEQPTPANDVKRATWNEPLPKGKAVPPADKAGAPAATAESKRVKSSSRAAKKPSRTLYEYMAQERP